VNVAIRADASLRIGSGHVMRCLCLADAIVARHGGAVAFLCRALPPHMAELIQAHGHALLPLPAWEEPGGLIEASWPRALRTRDLQDCSDALAGRAPLDSLVVDHYGADAQWERGARVLASRLMAIDDLVREHDCDLLLDSNLYSAGDAEYEGRVPAGRRRLVGPAYALLRPEFAEARAHARPREGAVHNLLVFLGGMDAQDATSIVLEAVQLLAPSQRPRRIDVVIGATHPRRAAIERLCADLGATLHANTTSMGSLCLAADLAVGAGGSATWERCATGLPSIALRLAANPERILDNGARAGLLYAPDPFPLEAQTLAVHLRAVMGNSGLRNHISRRGLETVDGQGASRVARALLR
jgi:UDP-2,4-diacetamido-2,4,6-trideoxy-beta-L-altropyranose hydrolase